MARLLLVDDDTELCEMLVQYLTGEGFAVDTAHDGNNALSKALASDYDLLILDIMLPQKNGLDVLRALRQKKQTPVLMLTARGEDIDSIIGLELGADDYLAKPCNPRVLVARIRAVLRRAGVEAEAKTDNTSQPEMLVVNDIEVNMGSRSVYKNSLPVAMTSTEYTVFLILLKNIGVVVTKNDLSEQALGRKLTHYDRSLDMHVSNLRKKLGKLPDGEERIKTVRGVGYLYSRIPSAT